VLLRLLAQRARIRLGVLASQALDLFDFTYAVVPPTGAPQHGCGGYTKSKNGSDQNVRTQDAVDGARIGA
jgi:hypothetical protein